MESKEDKLKKYVAGLMNKIEHTTFPKSQITVLDNVFISNGSPATYAFCEEIIDATMNLLKKVYGEDSGQYHTFASRFNRFLHAGDQNEYIMDKVFQICYGRLKGIYDALENNLLNDLESQISAEIFGDFILSADKALDENYKDIASVIGSAALEDTLKKIAKLKGLDTAEKDMSVVANFLKAKGLLKGTSSKLIDRYVILRNKALHAEWDKIEATDVRSMLGFTSQLLIEHFS